MHLNPEEQIFTRNSNEIMNLLISQGPVLSLTFLHVCFLSKIACRLYFSNKSCKRLDLLSGVSLNNMYSIIIFSFVPCLTANTCFALLLDTGGDFLFHSGNKLLVFTTQQHRTAASLSRSAHPSVSLQEIGISQSKVHYYSNPLQHRVCVFEAGFCSNQA